MGRFEESFFFPFSGGGREGRLGNIFKVC